MSLQEAKEPPTYRESFLQIGATEPAGNGILTPTTACKK